MAAPKSVTELANAIAKDTATVNEYFEKHNLPKPSFDENGPVHIRIPPTEPEAFMAHQRAVAATSELNILLQGPGTMFRRVFMINDLLYLHFVHRFDVASHVPVGGDISFEDLSRACGVDVLNLERFLRYAMTDHVFKETRTGFVSHTAASRALREDERIRDGTSMSLNEGFPAAANVVNAMERYPASQEPTESGWAVANSATKPMFEELALRHPKRAKAVANTMDSLAAAMPVDPLFEMLDLSSLGASAKIIDIGGSHGAVSIAMLKRSPSLKCIVQDLPAAIEAGEAKRQDLPENIKPRLEYQMHDFFDEQPVKDADVYFFRAVLHDWPDKYGIKILRALVPALKRGARIMLHEAVMPEAGTLPPTLEKIFRARDLNMCYYFNARERTADDWRELFAQADKRFKFQGVKRPSQAGAGMSASTYPALMEAVWEP